MLSIWTKLVDKGTLFHEAIGGYQVVDDAAVQKMADQFRQEASVPGFAGLPLDFDHLSTMTPEQIEGARKLGLMLPTEAMAWITDIEARPDGLYGKLERWSADAAAKVGTGAYAYISPTFYVSDMEVIPVPEGSPRQLRPIRLAEAALTNQPRMGVTMRVALNSKQDAVTGQAVRFRQDIKQTATNMNIVVNLRPDVLKTLADKLGMDPEKLRTMILELEGAKEQEELVEDRKDTNSAGAKPKDTEQAVPQPAAVGNGLPAVADPDTGSAKMRVEEYVRQHPGVPVHVAMARLAVRNS